jgi:hypothetical protein
LLQDATAKQGITNDFEDPQVGRGKMCGETAGVHLAGFTVGLVKDVLLCEAESGGIACPGKSIELLLGCVGEV